MAEITKLRSRQKRAKCPICGRPPEPAYLPFCSKRCADIDLGRWLGGSYRVESEEKQGEPERQAPRREEE